MADSTGTLFRDSDNVLTAVTYDGQRNILKNDGKSYYTLGTGGAVTDVTADQTAPGSATLTSPDYGLHGVNACVINFSVGSAPIVSASVTSIDPDVTLIDGVTVADADTVTANVTLTLADEPVDLSVTVTDAAGNSSTSTVTIPS